MVRVGNASSRTSSLTYRYGKVRRLVFFKIWTVRMGVDGVIFWFERPGARQAQNDCTRGRLCVADQSNTFPRYSPEAKRKQKKSGPMEVLWSEDKVHSKQSQLREGCLRADRIPERNDPPQKVFGRVCGGFLFLYKTGGCLTSVFPDRCWTPFIYIPSP
jgi:hypothetical protein